MKKNILLYNAVTISLILLVSILIGHHDAFSKNNRSENPFYEIFLQYNNDDKTSALNRLKDKFNDPHYSANALINYGQIMEREGYFKLAEKHYKLALKKEDKLAFTYLYALYKKYRTAESLKILYRSKEPETNYWKDYERATYYLKQGNVKWGIGYLRSAVNKGFNSTILLNEDPAFDSIRENRTFKRLYEVASYGGDKKRSPVKSMLQKEFISSINKPYGIAKELNHASHLEKTGDIKKAKEILAAFVNQSRLFRDKSIALFRLARIEARDGNRSEAKDYLDKFKKHILSSEKDSTGYKKLVGLIYEDIILNDKFLRDFF